MRTVRNQFLLCSAKLLDQRSEMIALVFLACVIASGFYQQGLVFADPGPVSHRSVGNGDMEKSHEQAFSIMQQQLRAYGEKLEDSERLLGEFQQKHGIISIEMQINLLLQQRNALDASLKKSRNMSMGYQEKLAWIQGQISQVPKEASLSKTTSEQGIIGSAKNNLLGLKLKELQLLTKYTETSPLIHAVGEEIDLLENFIKEQETTQAGSVTRGKNPLYREMEMQLFQTKANLVSVEAQNNVIVQQIADVENELERLRGLKPELDGLRRQVTSDESNYLNYLTKVGTTPSQDYQVQVGDRLDIKFFFNPELNETILVRPDGRIALQLVGEIAVVGHTVKEIRDVLIESYSGQLKNPEIAVLLRSSHVLPGSMSVTSRNQIGRGGGSGN